MKRMCELKPRQRSAALLVALHDPAVEEVQSWTESSVPEQPRVMRDGVSEESSNADAVRGMAPEQESEKSI